MDFLKKAQTNKLKMLAVTVLTAAVVAGEYHFVKSHFENKLKAKTELWAKKEAYYQKRIQELEKKSQTSDFRFYDYDASGIENKYLARIDTQKFVSNAASKLKALEMMRMQDVSSDEIKNSGAYTNRHGIKIADMRVSEIEAEIKNLKTALANTIKTKDYEKALELSIETRKFLTANLYKSSGRGEQINHYLLNFSDDDIKRSLGLMIQRAEKKAQDGTYEKNMATAFHDFHDINFAKSLLEARNIIEFNNSVVNVAYSDCYNKDFQDRTAFEEKKRLQRQAMIDSILQEQKKSKYMVPMFKLDTLKKGKHYGYGF